MAKPPQRTTGFVFAVVTNEFDLVFATSCDSHVFERLFVDRKVSRCRSIFWRHIVDYCTLASSQACYAGTEEFHKFTRYTLLSQPVGNGEGKIGRKRVL